MPALALQIGAMLSQVYDPDIRLLMVTAEAAKEDILTAARSGASGYIVKPFTKATLEEKLRTIFGKAA